MAIGDPYYQPPVMPPMLFMPGEDDAGINIDGTPVSNQGILPKVVRGIQGALATGKNAMPKNVVTSANAAPALATNLSVQGSGSAPPMPGKLPMRRPRMEDLDNAVAKNNTPPPALGRAQVNAPQSRGALFSSPDQGRRSNTMLSVQRPDLGIGTNEMLMRVGGAGLANAGQGGLAAYGAMFDQYGNIQDKRRANALAEYNADYRAEQDELARQDALKLAEAKAKGKAPDADTQAQIGQMDQALMDMQRAKAYLAEGNLTGFIDNNVVGLFDKFTGNKRAVGRKLLEKLRVDDTLLRIAQTKGAISNKEMDLFLAPSPDLNDQETVWSQWIDDRMQAIQAVRQRLSTGQTVDQSQQASQGQVDQFGNTGSGLNLSAADAIVGL